MRLIILFLVVSLIACGRKEAAQEIPDDILPMEKFSEIMTDVHLLEAVNNQKMIREDDQKVMTAEYYEQVFEKYQISREEFEKSYTFWVSRPEDMMLIYDQVINNLNKMEEQETGKAKDEP
jgi:hypothetical protein